MDLESEKIIIEDDLVNLEEYLLGIIIHGRPSKKSLIEVTSKLKEDYFQKKGNQAIFRAIKAVLGQGLEVHGHNVGQELMKIKLDGETFFSHLASLAQYAMMNNSNFTDNTYSKAISDIQERRRRLDIERHAILIRSQAIDPTVCIDDLENQVKASFKIDPNENALNTENYTVRPHLQALVEKTIERMKQGKKYSGIETGIEFLDDATRGLNPGEIIYIGARPGIGKSALMMSMVYNIAVKQNIPCGILSLEMTSEDLMLRMLSMVNHLSISDIKSPHPSLKDDMQNALEKSQMIDKAPIYLKFSQYPSIEYIKNLATLFKDLYDIKVLFIDYFSLISSGKKATTPRHEAMSYVSQSIKYLSMELGISIITLSQVSRNTNNRQPSLVDLRETGSIEQDANLIMFLHREEMQSVGKMITHTNFIIGKNRNGAIGNSRLAFVPHCTLYMNSNKKKKRFLFA